MRVVLGATCYRPSGAGTSTYVRGLLDEIDVEQRRQTTVIAQADAASLIPSGYSVKSVPVSAGARRAFINKITRPPGDLYHGLDVDLPVRWRGPTVATVHDLSVFDEPWSMPPFRARAEQLLLRHMARRADALIAVSDFTAERIRHRLHRDSIVIPEAPAAELRPPTADEVDAIRAKFDLPERFVLHVGTVEPRKNVGRLADACNALDIPLVLAGAEWQTKALSGRVIRLGFVPQAELPALYVAATVTAYVSVYEGFGLPPVEAMRSGAAVVCSPVASLRPLLGDDAAQWADPTDVDDIAAKLRAVLNDSHLRDALVAAGGAAIAKLTWATAAASTAEVWRSLA